MVTPSSLSELRTAARKIYRDAAQCTEDPLQSRVVALVLPHDLSWEDIQNASSIQHITPPTDSLTKETKAFLDDCLRNIRETKNCAFLIGGEAAIGDNVIAVGKICVKLQAALYCENSFARVDRGCGRPHVRRLPYFPQDALKKLADYSLIVTIDCRLPVAQFGYKGGPSQLITLDDDHLWQIDAGSHTSAAIGYLYDQVDAQSVIPGQNCMGLFPPPRSSNSLPDGKLTAASLCAVVAQLQPENAIVVDESITSGGQYWELSKGCPSFTHLTLTGGAIGCGPAMSVGAAIACPDRVVINIQADGSAMYSLQVTHFVFSSPLVTTLPGFLDPSQGGIEHHHCHLFKQDIRYSQN